MSDALAPMLPREAYSDLLGARWRINGRSRTDGIDCYGLLIEVYRRRGIAVPDLVTDAGAAARVASVSVGWQRIEKPVPGCAVLMRRAPNDPDSPAEHVGVYVGAGWILHSARMTGVTLTREADCPIVAFLDWAGEIDAPAIPTCADGLTVITYDAELNRSVRVEPWREALCLDDIAGGLHVIESDLRQGGRVVLAAIPHDATTFYLTLALLAVNIAASMLLMPKKRARDESPYYDLSGLRNTSGIGNPVPVVYGTMRAAGHILSAVQTASANNSALLSMLVCPSIGPIYSIAGITSDSAGPLAGSAIPKQIEIDGNPMSSYTGAGAEIRLGSNNQAPCSGFTEVTVQTQIGHTLQQNAPFVHQSVGAMSGFFVNIAFPMGMYAGTSGTGSGTVVFTIEYKPRGTPDSNYISSTHTVTRSRQSSFLETLRVPTASAGQIIPLAHREYDIRVTRTTAYPAPNVTQSQTDIDSIGEITRDQIAYTGRSLIAMTFAAPGQMSARVPTITATIQGRLVYAWDGISATTPVLTTVPVYSDNPAWCVLDVLLNDQFGLGRNGRLTLANIHLPSWVEWAQHCDTLIPDGRGGTMKRAVFGGAIDSVQRAWEWAQRAAESHWASLMLVGNKVRVIVHKVATPIYSFSAGNVRDVAIEYTGRHDRANVIEVQYLNSEALYEQDVATKTDTASVFDAGDAVVRHRFEAVGVTRAAQAYTLAQYLSNRARIETTRLSFTAGPESLHLLPGDVIYFNHDAISSEAGGRILGATSTTVQLDRAITAGSGTHKVTCRTSGDTLEERTLTAGTYARGAAITLTAAWSSTPTVGAPYMAGAVVTYRRTFRIVSIDTEPDLTRKIAAVQYADAVYSDDPGTVESFTDDMPSYRVLASLPTGASATWRQILGADGVEQDALRIEWRSATSADAVDIWTRPADGASDAWQCHGRHHGDTATICCGIEPNTSYAVSLVPVGPRGNARGGPDAGALTFVHTRGKTWRPAAATAGVSSTSAGHLLADCSRVDGAADYEWRYGSSWAGSLVVARTREPALSLPCPFWGRSTLRVRPRSSGGRYAESDASLGSIIPHAPASMMQQDLAHEAHPTWPGTKSGVAADTTITLSSSSLTGSYTTADLTPYLDGMSASLRVRATCGLQNVALQWAHGLFNFGAAHASQTWATAYLTGDELKERLTWDEAGQEWGGFGGSLYTWAGPVDVDAALKPSIAVDVDGAGFVAYSGPIDGDIASVAAQVTLNRPHTDYQPELSELAVVTLAYASAEPERMNLEFSASAGTNTNARTIGFLQTTANSVKLKVPTGKLLTVLAAQGVVTTGTTAGTYTVSAIVRNTTDSTDVVVATASTTSTGALLHLQAEGSRVAPLGTLAAGKEYQIGWFNAATSPGALTATNHHVRLTVLFEDA